MATWGDVEVKDFLLRAENEVTGTPMPRQCTVFRQKTET